MNLYFVRHGKTEWNLERRLQGRSGDSALLPESIGEIEQLGDYLSEICFDKIYCSPSLRARRTAQGIYAQLKQPCEIVFSENLREFGYGDLEGELIEVAHQKFPKEMHNLRYDLSHYDPSAFHGETITSVLDRVSHVVMQAILENKGNVLFVSHGAALTATIRHLAGFSLDQLRAVDESLKNNSVSILKAEGLHLPFELELWNDTSYLNEK
ncbi:probable phosphoglycerate mutase [Pilibacter termitis]|uniref:Probable phosphoglycerate mutase n=1 Tax=Pilibacter termitis TaxID=263852 RepID=A0A1T4NJQ1_9ENTE|nr:histidine phosphatase family protein [Pilibacter termitis]SJZ79353.1 probable phosphoglycerate mutase [Pilibacter termitis]